MGDWKIVVPEATTNLITNPSFETNTTGWAASGTNTIAKATTQARWGNNSLTCTYQDNTTMASYGITLTAAQYTFTAWVYLNSTWDGGAISLDIANYAGAGTDTASNTVTATGGWYKLTMIFTPVGGDLVGDVIVKTASAATAGRVIYVDAVQLELKGYATTYCDGDQEGCVWDGVTHGSTSTRSAVSRAGGRVKDLEDDYSFKIRRMIGTGMAPVENIMSGRALMAGAEYQRHIPLERYFTLVSYIKGTSTSNYNSLRQALIADISPDAVPDEEPIIFRYTGASADKEIRARYVGGMEMEGPDGGWFEHVALQLVADDWPFFEQIAETSTSLTVGSMTTTLIAARINGLWDNMGPPNAAGTYTAIEDIAIKHGSEMIIVGDFTNFDNNADADYIVKWDGSAWDDITAIAPCNAKVYAAVYAPDGTLYIGGNAFDIDAVVCRGVASWDGTTWSALGPPSSGGTVLALAIATNGDLYVGGSFANWDGIANADNIVKWDGAAWTALDTGVDGAVNALAFDHDGTLLVGGAFTQADPGGLNVTCRGIARWNITSSTWLAIGPPSSGGTVNTIAVAPNGNIYIGGNFTNWNGNAQADYIARWVGKWDSLSAGTNNIVHRLFWLPDGDLLVTGLFTSAGGLDLAAGLAVWNGAAYYQLDIDLPATSLVRGLDLFGDDIYIGFDQDDTSYFPGASGNTVTNAGTARAFPTIQINRSGGTTATLESVINTTTGKKLLFDIDLADGETIIIDTRPGQRVMLSNGSSLGLPEPGWPGYVRDWRMQPNSDLTSFYLIPGDNVLAFYISVTGAPTITASIRWRDSYWSID
jgi:hypothetical protein